MKKIFVFPILFVIIIFFYQSPSLISAEECPEGYTCPSTPPESIDGEVIPVTKTVSKYGNPRDALKGQTGPEKDKLVYPELTTEDLYYKDQEILNRSLPSDLLKEQEFKKRDFQAKIGHPGCEKLYVDGADAGPVELDQKTTNFETQDPYENLFLTTRYWQALVVPDQGTKLKITATQPEFPDPPTNDPDCFADSGSTFDAKDISSGEPPEVGILGQALSFLGSILNGLLCTITDRGQVGKCSVEVKFNIQQQKYIPGEKTFDQQTVGKDGFLNFFKPSDIEFSKDKTERDEDEKSEYFAVGEKRAVGSDKQVGVTYEGMSSFQAGTCDLVKSLYPSDLSVNCLAPTDLEPSSGTTTP